MAGPTTVRIDLKTIGPIVALGLVVLVIIFVELCGREDVKPLGDQPPSVVATLGPTFTPGPSPTPGAVAVTPTVEPGIDAAQRDQVRKQDLAAIATALQQYFQKHQSYPDTKGSIQSLCVFRDNDLGCKLEEVLKPPLPVDPLGAAAQNGYWLESEATTFVVYAQSETTPAQPCSEHPQHLAKFRNVICVRGP
jgi:type II secretory pathway pseudopilin PulG